MYCLLMAYSIKWQVYALIATLVPRFVLSITSETCLHCHVLPASASCPNTHINAAEHATTYLHAHLQSALPCTAVASVLPVVGAQRAATLPPRLHRVGLAAAAKAAGAPSAGPAIEIHVAEPPQRRAVAASRPGSAYGNGDMPPPPVRAPSAAAAVKPGRKSVAGVPMRVPGMAVESAEPHAHEAPAGECEEVGGDVETVSGMEGISLQDVQEGSLAEEAGPAQAAAAGASGSSCQAASSGVDASSAQEDGSGCQRSSSGSQHTIEVKEEAGQQEAGSLQAGIDVPGCSASEAAKDSSRQDEPSAG